MSNLFLGWDGETWGRARAWAMSNGIYDREKDARDGIKHDMKIYYEWVKRGGPRKGPSGTINLTAK